MNKYETLDLELEEETHKLCIEKAGELNMSLDQFVSEVLENYFSQRITTDDFLKLLEMNELGTWKEFYTIIDDFGKPIAKIKPIS